MFQDYSRKGHLNDRPRHNR